MTSTRTPSVRQPGRARHDDGRPAPENPPEARARPSAAPGPATPGRGTPGPAAPGRGTPGPAVPSTSREPVAAEPAAATGPGRRAGRTGRTRTGPPGRQDTRRPGGRARPADSALRAAARQAREHLPHHWFAGRLLLVLSGRQPAHTLLRHLRGGAFEELDRLAPLAPLRPRGADRGMPELASVRGKQPCAGVIEASARVVTDGRSRALAFRLEEGRDRRWRCSALHLDITPGR